MATTDDIATQYADYIRLNRKSPTAIKELAEKINSLVYTESEKPISDEDKKVIIDKIESKLSHKRTAPGGGLISEAEDSTELVRLIQLLQSEINKK